MEDKEIITYCVLDKDGMNKAVKIESNELNDWKQVYIKGFCDSYISSLEESLDVRKNYCDPDQTYKKGYNHLFFNQLIMFLRKREEQLVNELKGKFNYEFVEDKGIKVSQTNKNKEEVDLFYLRSDQLGFSAPSNEKSHPYDLYIKKNINIDEAVKQVTDWIIGSRTIGGSFLWPRPFYDTYNQSRGGKINSSRKYYIQDRVDLTLWEIKNWYKKINKNTIMNRQNTRNSNLNIWLGHFTNFETYVKFFHFDTFVKQTSNEISPINILTNEINEPIWGCNGENPEIEISNKLSKTEVESLLTLVNNCILERSKAINCYVLTIPIT